MISISLVLVSHTDFKKMLYLINWRIIRKENRIYIRGEFRESLGRIYFSPFKPEREFKTSKCTNHVNVHKLYAVEYINTVCSLDYLFQFRIF